MLEIIGFTIAGFVLGIIVTWIYLGETTRELIRENMILRNFVTKTEKSLLKYLERMRDGLQNERG